MQNPLQTEIEAVGPWGPVIFVVSVAAGEMIPLLPTQPLAIAGGLLFGAVRVSHLPSGPFYASLCKARMVARNLAKGSPACKSVSLSASAVCEKLMQEWPA